MMDYAIATTYCDGHETYPAIAITHEHVEEILGHPHRGKPADDEALVQRLLEDGAPEWVEDAPGFVGEQVWGLYNEAEPYPDVREVQDEHVRSMDPDRISSGSPEGWLPGERVEIVDDAGQPTGETGRRRGSPKDRPFVHIIEIDEDAHA